MSVAGPMARGIEDLRLALRILAGLDGHDAHVPPVPWRDPDPPDASGLRIAWSTSFPGGTQDEIGTAVEDMVRGLDRRGVRVEEALPAVDPKDQYELGEELFGLLAGTFSAEQTAFSEETGAAPEGRGLDPLEGYLAALDRRDGMIRAWDSFFAGWDALVLPAGTKTAERQGEEPADPSEEYPYALSLVSGCPMVVIPAGVDGRWLPFGLQVLGRRWDDERLLEIARLLSELTPRFRRPPGY